VFHFSLILTDIALPSVKGEAPAKGLSTSHFIEKTKIVKILFGISSC
jgi:hypothetical protein